MDKYIPYEKLSKKEKRKLDTAKRNTWGNLNPVTRKPENSKAYNRKKMQNWKKDLPNSASFCYPLGIWRAAMFAYLALCLSANYCLQVFNILC